MLSRKVYVSQFGMNMKLMSLRLVLIALVLALGPLCSDAHAATAANIPRSLTSTASWFCHHRPSMRLSTFTTNLTSHGVIACGICQMDGGSGLK